MVDRMCHSSAGLGKRRGHIPLCVFYLFVLFCSSISCWAIFHLSIPRIRTPIPKSGSTLWQTTGDLGRNGDRLTGLARLFKNGKPPPSFSCIRRGIQQIHDRPTFRHSWWFYCHFTTYRTRGGGVRSHSRKLQTPFWLWSVSNPHRTERTPRLITHLASPCLASNFCSAT